MIGLETQIGEKRFAFFWSSLEVFKHSVYKISRRIERTGHGGRESILKPMDFVRMRQVAFARFPVVRPSITLHNRVVKTTAIGQIVWLGPDVPLARNRRAVACILKKCGNGNDIGV